MRDWFANERWRRACAYGAQPLGADAEQRPVEAATVLAVRTRALLLRERLEGGAPTRVPAEVQRIVAALAPAGLTRRRSRRSGFLGRRGGPEQEPALFDLILAGDDLSASCGCSVVSPEGVRTSVPRRPLADRAGGPGHVADHALRNR